VSADWVYIDFYQWNHRRIMSIGMPFSESADDSATSLYEDPGLNPSVIQLVKSSEKNPRHHTVATFQKNYIICRWYGRYIPTELETELYPSVKITDEKILSVISLVFADFLVVSKHHGYWILQQRK